MRIPFVIAEVGINHNGDIHIAKQLIDMAKRCGADAVKFQKRTVELVYTKEFLNSPRESPWGKTQRAQKNGLEFGKEEYDEIDYYCKKNSIYWFASPWDTKSVEFLGQYDLTHNKISHQMVSDGKILEAVAQQKRMTFISSLSPRDATEAEFVFRHYDCPFLMMCATPLYPTPDDKCNLKILNEYAEEFEQFGFSCHSPSLLAPIMAVTMGAIAVEIHITLDRTMYGSDQPASFEEEGLRRVVRDVHRIKEIMGCML